jgi:lipopolysaccharide/colanic/teichoic acid biosynthesis glycosyltransferase
LIDFVCALILFVLTAPLVVLIALLVKVTSRGPAFYTQTRAGLNGRPYTLYKIRTMRHNCERHSGPCWSSRGDRRVTWLGAFLRSTHLDELPQLWNVLRGEMSLVGPRPERPEFFPVLTQAIPHYADRLLVRPGVTGLAQVKLAPDTDIDSVRRKLIYDMYYIHHMSLGLDVRLVLCTVLKMVGMPFWLLSWTFRLPTVATEVPMPKPALETPQTLPPVRPLSDPEVAVAPSLVFGPQLALDGADRA